MGNRSSAGVYATMTTCRRTGRIIRTLSDLLDPDQKGVSESSIASGDGSGPGAGLGCGLVGAGFAGPTLACGRGALARIPPTSFPPKLTFGSSYRTTLCPVHSSVSSDLVIPAMIWPLVLLRTIGLSSSLNSMHQRISSGAPSLATFSWRTSLIVTSTPDPTSARVRNRLCFSPEICICNSFPFTVVYITDFPVKNGSSAAPCSDRRTNFLFWMCAACALQA